MAFCMTSQRPALLIRPFRPLGTFSFVYWKWLKNDSGSGSDEKEEMMFVSLLGWYGFHLHRSKPLLSRRCAKLLLFAVLSIADN